MLASAAACWANASKRLHLGQPVPSILISICYPPAVL
jgi:hypothetical protein